jgi:hypothetical protein
MLTATRQCRIEPLETRTLLSVMNVWQHDSQDAAVVYCETAEPSSVHLQIEGESSARPSFSGKHGHFWHVDGLLPGEAVDAVFYQDGQPTGQGVTLQPVAFANSTPIDSPTTIATPGHYHLTADIDAPGTAITVQASGVTLDLNGHTITYGNSEFGYGVHGDTWNRSGLEVFNGFIREGVSRTNQHPIYSIAMQGAEIAGVEIEYAGDDSMAIYLRDGHAGYLHHSVVRDRGTGISNRHVGVTTIGILGTGIVAEHNVITTRHRAFNLQGGDTIQHNEFMIDSWATNAGAVLAYGKTNVSANYNYIYGRGEHVIAISFTGGGSDSEAVGNYVELSMEGPINRSGEYGDRASAHGIRCRDDSSNLDIRDNEIIIRLAGKAYGTGYWVGGGLTNHNIVVQGGSVTVETEDLWDDFHQQVACMSVMGNGSDPGPHPVVLYRDIRMESPLANVLLGEPGGVGHSARIEDCTLVRTGNDPRYSTLRAGFWIYGSTGTEFEGTTLEGGASFGLVEWIGSAVNNFWVVEPDGTRVFVDRDHPYEAGST